MKSLYKFNLYKLTFVLFFLIISFSLNISAKNKYNIIINENSNSNVDKEVINSIIQDIDISGPEDYNKILKVLYETGNFEEISINFEGNNLIINFKELLKINSVKFYENERFKKEEILDMFKNQNFFSIYDKGSIDKFISELTNLYANFGYNQFEVSYELISLDYNYVNLEFFFNEGTISKINKVYFDGNNVFTKKDLFSEIKSNPRNSLLFFINRNFKYYVAQNDKFSLIEFYKKNGYKDVTVVLKTEYINENNKFNIYFYIDEGKIYNFENFNIQYKDIEISIDQKNDLNNILDSFTDKKNLKENFFNISLLDKISESFSDYLFNQGINFFDVGIKEKVTVNNVDIIFEIESTEVKYVNQINIYGNNRTLEEVIRREVTFAEGDSVTDLLISKTNKNLQRLNIFNKVDITEQNIDDEYVDINIDVNEKSTGEFNIGLSVGSLDGASFMTKLKENNFLGTGRNAELEVNTSSSNTVYNAKVVEPYFLNKNLSLITGIGYSEKDYSQSASYNVNSINTNIGINYEITEDLFHNISLLYDLKDYEVTNANLVSSSIAASEGTNANFYLNNYITYSKLNSFINPTRGGFIQYKNVLSPITNSTNGSLKNVILLKKYIPLADNSYTFSYQSRIGNILSLQDTELKSDEKFSLGGRWLRGFDNYGVGPRKSKTSYIGGNNIIAVKLDLKKPLIQNSDNPVDLNLFTDFGTVYGNKTDPTFNTNSIRASYGFGFNFYSPIGPIGFSWGFPISDESHDIKRMFNFNIGNLDW